MTKIPGGLFITLEGIEGCGKTTQAARLAGYLRERGYAATLTREPGGTKVGARIREILLDPKSAGISGLTELLLYSADRAQHLYEVIEPALGDGGIVVCDRFTDATAAYQGAGRGLDAGLIGDLAEVATRGCAPDLTLLFDLPAESGLARAIGRMEKNGTQHEGRFEAEAVEFHDKVRRGYLAIASCEPGRVKTIDASRGIDEVWESVKDTVEERISGL